MIASVVYSEKGEALFKSKDNSDFESFPPPQIFRTTSKVLDLKNLGDLRQLLCNQMKLIRLTIHGGGLQHMSIILTVFKKGNYFFIASNSG